MKKALSIVGIAIAALFLALPLQAQPRGAGGGQTPSPAQVERKLKKVRARVLREHVGLSEEQAVKVEAIIERFAPQSRKLEQRMRDAKETVRYLFETDSNDQKAYAKALAKLRRSQKAKQKLRDRQFEEIQKVLLPKQQAKLLFALKKMQKRVRQEMRRRKRQAKGQGQGRGRGQGQSQGQGRRAPPPADDDDGW